MPRRFLTLDVFTDAKFTGNPLAVVLDGEDLSVSEMQTIAREFNLSETTFVLPPEDPENTARVRIFTPASELPFAGHPTIGTAVALATERSIGPDLMLEENVGVVPVKVTRTASGGNAVFKSPLLSEPAGTAPASGKIAEALGIDETGIGFDGHTPGIFSAGFPVLFVPVRDLETLGAAYPNMAVWQVVLDGCGARLAYLYTARNDGYDMQTRCFAPSDGVMEDPATGSAVATLPGQLLAQEAYSDGRHDLTIGQGIEMGRESRIDLGFTISGSALSEVRIGGSAVFVQRGELLN